MPRGSYQARGGPVAKTQLARNPQLAIEALRKLITEESVRNTRNHLVRQRAFSDRITELMTKYTNQQLTSAQVIAELVAFAREIRKRSMTISTPSTFCRTSSCWRGQPTSRNRMRYLATGLRHSRPRKGAWPISTRMTSAGFRST